MRSNAGMANTQGDVDLRFAQVSNPQLTLWLGLAWLGLAWLGKVSPSFMHSNELGDVERVTLQFAGGV